MKTIFERVSEIIEENRKRTEINKQEEPEKIKDRYDILMGIKENKENFELFINSYCPNSEEKRIALIRLEEVMMWANSSVIRNRE